MVAANARTAITFALSPGQASDAVEGRRLLAGIGPLPAPLHLIMDKAYEDNQTLQLALDFGYIPVVPPRPNRLDPWQLDRANNDSKVRHALSFSRLCVRWRPPLAQRGRPAPGCYQSSDGGMWNPSGSQFCVNCRRGLLNPASRSSRRRCARSRKRQDFFRKCSHCRYSSVDIRKRRRTLARNSPLLHIAPYNA